MSNGTGDIIIKGGSAEVEFDGGVYKQDPKNRRKYKNADKKIVRVVITGDIKFDSGENAGGLRCEITAFCK
ncbi:MAG: hypothetical protein H0U18_02365 [Pyrinomonadaceae bacterium]|jgi:hypothetical protein|nr:hypothetical protein [Pyrinomonadaceae bacterium]